MTKRASRSRRAPSPLPDFLNQRLSHYALAATTAGVSLLALSPVANSEIIYTPADISVGIPSELHRTALLDLNNDGIIDFRLVADSRGSRNNYLSITPNIGNRVQSFRPCSYGSSYCTYAAALVKGAGIGSSRRFSFEPILIEAAYADRGNYVYRGVWRNVRNHYLGLKFEVDGQTHYGWARMSVHVQGLSMRADITGYAYETVPGQHIRAGQRTESVDAPASDAIPNDGSLGALATGAAGLSRTPATH